MKNLKPWAKEGEPSKLAGKFGKWLASQNFRNPATDQLEEFVLFGQKDWSVVLALTEDKQVLVVRQYKQGCNKIVDELPAGTADFKDETPEEVMKRELRQETGHEAAEMIFLGSYWIATRNSPTRFHCFLATGCRQVCEARYDASEEIEWRKVTLADWLSMVQTSGTIEEPSAVVTTMRALQHIGYDIMQVQKEIQLAE